MPRNLEDMEASLESPLKWDPKDVEKASLKALENIISIAVESDLIGSKTAKNILKIIEINPHARLSRLGQRLAILSQTAQDLKSIESRLARAIMYSVKEMDELRAIINSHPNWRQPQAPQEGGDKEEGSSTT